MVLLARSLNLLFLSFGHPLGLHLKYGSVESSQKALLHQCRYDDLSIQLDSNHCGVHYMALHYNRLADAPLSKGWRTVKSISVSLGNTKILHQQEGTFIINKGNLTSNNLCNKNEYTAIPIAQVQLQWCKIALCTIIVFYFKSLRKSPLNPWLPEVGGMGAV